MRGFIVRRDVLNMNIGQWVKFGKQEAFIGTAECFLDAYGLPGGLSAKFTQEERDFFDELYVLYRGR